MGVNLSSPVIQVFDDDGNPGVGYRLYSYEVGTTTPKALYTDKDCTVAASNPVVMDSRGEATVFMEGTYKLVMQDATGSVVWTVAEVGEDSSEGETQYVYYVDPSENDQGVQGNGGTLYAILNSLTFNDTAANIIFRGPEAGSVLLVRNYYLSTSLNDTAYTRIRYIFDMGAQIALSSGVSLTTNAVIDAGFYQIFDGTGTVRGNPVCEAIVPEWWGCVGDGSTDDSIYMTRAWNHYWQRDMVDDETGRESLGIFRFTSGRNYYLTTGLSVTITNHTIGGWCLSGYGAKIKSNLSSGHVISISTQCTTRNLILEGLYIYGGSGENGLIYLSGGQETSAQFLYCLTLRDIHLFGSNGHGLYLHGSIFEATIKDCNIYLNTTNTTGYGVAFDPAGQNSGQLSLYDVNCYYGLNNFRIVSTSYPSFIQCAGHEAHQHGYYLQSHNTAMVNCYVENSWNSAASQDAAGAGIYLSGSGTLVNCFGGTNKVMKYAVEIYATGQINVFGGGANGLVAYGYIAGSATDAASICWMSSQTYVEKSYGTAKATVHVGNGKRTAYVSTSGTNETTLGSYEAAEFLQKQSYTISAFGVANGSDAKTMELNIGAYPITVMNAVTSSEDWRLDATIYAFSDTVQQVSWVLYRPGAMTSGVEQFTQDGTNGLTFSITATMAASTSSLTVFSFMADRKS